MRGPAILMGTLVAVLSLPARALEITVDGSSEPHPGLRIDALSVASPKVKAWAAYVDLCGRDVHLGATASPSSLQTAGAWGSSMGAELAINGDFYLTGPVRVYGAAVGNGQPWPANKTGTDPAYSSSWYYQKYGFIAFGPSWVEISHTGWVKDNADKFGGLVHGWRPADVTHAIPPGTVALVSGFPELVVEGARVTCSSPTASDCFPDRSDMRDRHPRTAMGITEDRRTVIFVVVDGRTSTSIGMYGAELAELMDQLGAWEAFNLDGGGSTQMWLAGNGYLNNTSGNNSGNGTRAVANHWGVFAGGGKAAPSHCVDYLVEGVLNVAEGASTDLDGDGRAEACLRGPEGIVCASGASDGLASPELLVSLPDDQGWDDLRNAATLRMGDVDGDGKADACIRANAGIRCWLSEVAPLGTPIDGPAHSDDGGWNALQYHTTLRLADFDGDGRSDVCARASVGWVCYPSTGDGFGEGVASGVFSDESGFDDPDNYMTIRTGDVDGDGTDDVCARSDEGMRCYLAPDFATEIIGPAWSDEAGWSAPRHWGTIRLVDLDGDGRADLCGRASAGLECHLSTGDGFAPPLMTGLLDDASGYDAPALYSTLRFGDIDGDRDLDVCARGPNGFLCWPFEGDGFGDAIAGPSFGDDGDWFVSRLYASPRLADVSGDGLADLCLRRDDGLWCAISHGDGFGEPIFGPEWAGQGYESPAVYGTLSLGQPPCTAGVEWCNGVDDDCNGVVDDGCEEGPGGGGGDGSGGAPSTAGVTESADGGCSCAVLSRPREGGGFGWLLLALGGAALRRRRA